MFTSAHSTYSEPDQTRSQSSVFLSHRILPVSAFFSQPDYLMSARSQKRANAESVMSGLFN